jgi:hypothetical protein
MYPVNKLSLKMDGIGPVQSAGSYSGCKNYTRYLTPIEYFVGKYHAPCVIEKTCMRLEMIFESRLRKLKREKSKDPFLNKSIEGSIKELSFMLDFLFNPLRFNTNGTNRITIRDKNIKRLEYETSSHKKNIQDRRLGNIEMLLNQRLKEIKNTHGGGWNYYINKGRESELHALILFIKNNK